MYSFHTCFVWVDIDAIITTLSFNVNSLTDVYTLERKKSCKTLDEFVADCQQQNQYVKVGCFYQDEFGIALDFLRSSWVLNELSLYSLIGDFDKSQNKLYS